MMGSRYNQGYHSRGGQGDNRSDYTPPSDQDIQQIIADGDVVKLVDTADHVGKALADQSLTTSQIRNVFGTVRQIQMRWEGEPEKSYREAVLIRPKLAYFAEREKKAKKKSYGMETLQKVLEPALKLVSAPNLTELERRERYDRFVELFEAIVAYHKKHGGRDH
jgi:CRISPR-associated protein Csm2